MPGLFDDLLPKNAKAASMSVQAQNELKDKRKASEDALETQIQVQQALPALERLRPGPVRGALLDMALPSGAAGKGSFWDKAGTVLIGAPATRLGIIPPQDVADYQRVRGLSNLRVLAGQLPQKGPQTESDAARILASEIDVGKGIDTNRKIAAASIEQARRARARSAYYSVWANKLGLNGVNARGQSVEQAFQEYLAQRAAKAAQAAPPDKEATAGEWRLVK